MDYNELMTKAHENAERRKEERQKLLDGMPERIRKVRERVFELRHKYNELVGLVFQTMDTTDRVDIELGEFLRQLRNLDEQSKNLRTPQNDETEITLADGAIAVYESACEHLEKTYVPVIDKWKNYYFQKIASTMPQSIETEPMSAPVTQAPESEEDDYKAVILKMIETYYQIGMPDTRFPAEKIDLEDRGQDIVDNLNGAICNLNPEQLTKEDVRKIRSLLMELRTATIMYSTESKERFYERAEEYIGQLTDRKEYGGK